MASYNEEFKKRIVRMHLEEGRTIRSMSEEYHVSENGIVYWLKKSIAKNAQRILLQRKNTTS